MVTRRVEFEAVIYRQGILRCIDVPEGAAAAFDGWRYPPVVLAIAGVERATTLMRRGDGGFRVFVHDELRRAAAADTGDTVRVALAPDDAPIEPLPDELLDAAAAIEGGVEQLEILPPGLRREMLRFVADARSAATRSKRIERCVELLAQRADKEKG